jgi:hypothetical protein
MLKAKRNEINEHGKEKKPANEMNEINEQGNEKKPANEMNEINEQGNEHVINLFETEIFLSRFTNIFNLIYFPLQIVNKK